LPDDGDCQFMFLFPWERLQGKILSITIGTLPYEGSALIYIAHEHNFFKANGLVITIKDYETDWLPLTP